MRMYQRAFKLTRVAESYSDCLHQHLITDELVNYCRNSDAGWLVVVEQRVKCHQLFLLSNYLMRASKHVHVLFSKQESLLCTHTHAHECIGDMHCFKATELIHLSTNNRTAFERDELEFCERVCMQKGERSDNQCCVQELRGSALELIENAKRAFATTRTSEIACFRPVSLLVH